MGPVAKTVGIFYLVLVVIGVVFVLGIAWSTLVRPRQRADTGRLAERERMWLVVVLGLLAALLLSTIFFTPYGGGSPGRQIVRVTARQFSWEIRPSRLKADQPIEFRLDSADVSHAFAIYDSSDVLLKQVQVVPDHQQRMDYTFDEPGTYRILCLEYCGVGHHLMETTIEVVP